jgi:hypothetical protein
MKTEHKILAVINTLLLVGFGGRFLLQMNYEFVIYVSVILFFFVLIALSLHKVPYTLASLIGLTVWSALHLAGGAVPVGDGRLYDCMLIPLSTEYPIFRYDQLVHIFGFGVATLVMYCLLIPLLKQQFQSSIGLGIVLVMAGLGVGAFNEIVEFIVNIIVPESGVGGYINSSLDLCSNLIGALFALVYIRLRYQNQTAAAECP